MYKNKLILGNIVLAMRGGDVDIYDRKRDGRQVFLTHIEAADLKKVIAWLLLCKVRSRR